MTPHQFRRLSSAVLDSLRAESPNDIASLRGHFPGVPDVMLEKSLQGLRARGLVTYLEVLGPDGVYDIQLTAGGLEYEPETPSRGSSVRVVVHGGNVQIGNENTLVSTGVAKGVKS